jgi:hypothetical protein
MQDTAMQQCKAAPVGSEVLVDKPCNATDRAQRWRVATRAFGSPTPAAAALLSRDSRLESAVQAGKCTHLDESGILKVGPCLESGFPVKNSPSQVCASEWCQKLSCSRHFYALAWMFYAGL